MVPRTPYRHPLQQSEMQRTAGGHVDRHLESEKSNWRLPFRDISLGAEAVRFSGWSWSLATCEGKVSDRGLNV